MITQSPALPDRERSLLTVGDDAVLAGRLARALEGQGYCVKTALSGREALSLARVAPPAFAVVDLKLADGNGIDVVTAIRQCRPGCRAVILTGYANSATAVMAVNRGAYDYLAKPADAFEIDMARTVRPSTKPNISEHLVPARVVHWERIRGVFESCGRNVSVTARRLGMFRRKLQRMISKHTDAAALSHWPRSGRSPCSSAGFRSSPFSQKRHRQPSVVRDRLETRVAITSGL